MHETRYVYSSSVSHPSWTADENSSPDQLTTYCVVCWHVTSTCVIFVSYLYRATMCNLISVVLRWYDEANTHLKEVLNPKWIDGQRTKIWEKHLPSLLCSKWHRDIGRNMHSVSRWLNSTSAL